MSSLIVDVCEITKVEKHPDADALDILTIKGWDVIEKRDRFKPGDTVVYFPIESILPIELSDKLKCTQYLVRGRVRAARLRGIVSCGLCGPNEGDWPIGTDLTEHYGIKKYEPPEPGSSFMGGQNIKDPNAFQKYTGLENWNNYPNILQDGEEIVAAEKIHGTNWRAALIDDQFFIGSHYRTKAYDPNVVYWQAAIDNEVEARMRDRLSKDHTWILFGEVFGKVQDLKYGLGSEKVALRLFDIAKDGYYLDYDDFETTATLLDLPICPLIYRGAYSAAKLAELAQGQAFQGEHIREGVVVRPTKERTQHRFGRVILKKINPAYLVRKGNTTEYH